MCNQMLICLDNKNKKSEVQKELCLVKEIKAGFPSGFWSKYLSVFFL